MADLTAVIDSIVVGDDYDIIRDISTLPIGQGIAEAWLTIKENVWDTTTILSKHITGTVSSGGIIEDDGLSDTIGRIRFTLLNSETVLLKEFYRYTYDIQIKTT
jgi:hypothetical protein